MKNRIYLYITPIKYFKGPTNVVQLFAGPLVP